MRINIINVLMDFINTMIKWRRMLILNKTLKMNRPRRNVWIRFDVWYNHHVLHALAF